MESLETHTDSPGAGSARSIGSHDGDGAGDHDQEYRFGRRPRTSVPFPFNTRQYARLLVLRGRLRDTPGEHDNLINLWQPQAA